MVGSLRCVDRLAGLRELSEGAAVTDIARDIGRHDADIENLKSNVQAIRADLDEIKELLAQTRGGWRVLLAVGITASSMGAALVKLFTWKFGT